jgi:hypothetical protein
MSATTALAIVMVAWLAIGVVTGIAMGRRGHDGFTWLVLGATLGPLVVPLALSTHRRTGPSLRPVAQGWPQGPPPIVTADSGRRSAPAPLAGWSSSGRTCTSGVEVHHKAATLPPAVRVGHRGKREATEGGG